MKHHFSRGFTLLEALVAVTILVLSIIGPFVAASVTLNNALIASDRITASYLAQEGIEYVRSLREGTYLTDVAANRSDANTVFYTDFLAGALTTSVTACRGSGTGAVLCALDPGLPKGIGAGDALQICTSGTCPALMLSGGLYNLTSGTATPFTRSIQFYDLGNVEEVLVTVSWKEHGVPYTVTSTDYLSPWE